MDQFKLTRRGFLAGTAATGALAALALSGCGSKEEEGGAGEATAASTIYAAPAYSSTNVNPVGLNGGSALMLAATWHVFEGLYDLDLVTYKTYNALAAGEPTKVSDTEYEVAIREGAMFSNGAAVTAADVVNAIEVNMADGTCGAFLSFLESAAAKDDATVSLKLKYPFEALLKDRLATVKVFPAASTEDELKTMPVGSGPWMYESVNGDDGGTIKFVPNPNYNGPKPATCTEMDWNILLDGTARTTAITDQSVLAIENVPDANAEQIAGSGATVEYVPGFGQAFLMFNTKKAPFDDKRVRQAFYYAIDMDKLISNQMAGHAKAVKGFLNESHANFHEAATVYSYDPEKAKALLAEAGQESIDFDFMVNNNWVAALAPQIKEDLAAVGINATINETKIDWAALAPSESILPYDVMLTPGDPTCFGNDPDMLLTWWYGDNVWTQGRSCWAGSEAWTELQGLMQQARESADASAQQELWNKCFDILADEVPLYALFHREIATGYIAEKLDGFAPIATTGLVFLGATPLQ